MEVTLERTTELFIPVGPPEHQRKYGLESFVRFVPSGEHNNKQQTKTHLQPKFDNVSHISVPSDEPLMVHDLYFGGDFRLVNQLTSLGHKSAVSQTARRPHFAIVNRIAMYRICE